MANLSAVVQGSLQVKPTAAATVDEQKSSGCSYGLSLRDQNKAPACEISQQIAKTTSGSFVALPFPANLRARVLYMRMRTSDPIQVRITQEVAGVTLLANVNGMILMEFSDADRITMVEVDGTAEFEWAAFGDQT
jgi:hypothetical protein